MRTIPFDDAGSAGNGVGFGLIDGDDIPHRIAGFGVESDEPAVEGAEIYLAVVEGDSAIDDVTADGADIGARYFGIEGPQDFAGPRIERICDAPLASGVDHTVGDEGSRFEATGGAEFSAPEQAELADVLFVDQGQGAEALLVVGSSVGGPVGAVQDGYWSRFSAAPEGDEQRAND